MQTIRLLISGKVQGVWYRKSTLAKAKEFNLQGTVRNLEDGRVEVIASGSKDKVNQLVDWCKRGPDLAEVESIELKEIEDQFFSEFKVL
ncbi:MAG: acylphosphatase [Saprospirales bacterium]|nr:MAG: acylphosphatase [Saprospirales bacterium]